LSFDFTEHDKVKRVIRPSLIQFVVRVNQVVRNDHRCVLITMCDGL